MIKRISKTTKKFLPLPRAIAPHFTRPVLIGLEFQHQGAETRFAQKTARVDVKFREPGKPITKSNLSNLNSRIDHANRQIRESQEGRGDIVFDASQAAPSGMNPTEIERYLNGKMMGNRSDPDARLSNVEHLEIIYSGGGQLKRSFILRTVDGKVNGPFTEVLR